MHRHELADNPTAPNLNDSAPESGEPLEGSGFELEEPEPDFEEEQ